MLKATTILIVIAIALIVPVVAQVEIECADDLAIVNGIDVQFPNVDAEEVHTITLLGIRWWRFSINSKMAPAMMIIRRQTLTRQNFRRRVW